MTNTLTVEHRECLEQATQSVFSATCGLDLQMVPCEGQDPAGAVVVAVISLVGDVEWSLFLGLPRDTAVAMASKFAQFEIPYESGDLADAIGELTNILAGDVKQRLDQIGVKADISLPNVMRGENLQVMTGSNKPVEQVCWTSPAGRLWTGVVVGKRSAA